MKTITLPVNQTTYISGPMTGLPEYNFPAFFAAEDALAAQGWNVINPACNGKSGGEWHHYLRADLQSLLDDDCNTLHLLDGWEKSRGAILESFVASELGFTLIAYPSGKTITPPEVIRALTAHHIPF